MNKNGIGTKGLYSNTIDNVQTRIKLEYNSITDHIGIYTGFCKSAGFVSGIVNNKNCGFYLGVTIAEQLLAKIFKNVERMPNNNKGFDFKCNLGYMIDVKSATRMKTQNGWSFAIRRNPIADYFLCLAFDNRLNLNPLHVWLIPSKRVCNLTILGISQATINKWSQYELTDKLDKVITCCNIMKGDN